MKTILNLIIIMGGFHLVILDAICQSPLRPAFKLVFYNTENFYDWENDPNTNDEDFLPESMRHWTKNRFEAKANNLFKVFAAMGENNFPDIIGLAEVENKTVLNFLIQQTPMKKVPLKIIHQDSPDPRGIDACMLYRSDRMTLLNSEFIAIRQKNGNLLGTRDIVYSCFLTQDKSRLHVFINHWPSRRGGELQTQDKRFLVAKILRHKVDSILLKEKNARIILLGDFNDEPFSKSITDILNAKSFNGKVSSEDLYNLATTFFKNYKTGTLKFKGNWSVFDQVIVSGSLLGKKGLCTLPEEAGIFNENFLLLVDKNHMGYMPFRTYNGLKYSGGFSDHLPVFINLFYNQ